MINFKRVPMNYQEHARCSRNNLQYFKFENSKISHCHYSYIHHPCNAFTFRHDYPHCGVRRGPDQLGARHCPQHRPLRKEGMARRRPSTNMLLTSRRIGTSSASISGPAPQRPTCLTWVCGWQFKMWLKTVENLVFLAC